MKHSKVNKSDYEKIFTFLSNGGLNKESYIFFKDGRKVNELSCSWRMNYVHRIVFEMTYITWTGPGLLSGYVTDRCQYEQSVDYNTMVDYNPFLRLSNKQWRDCFESSKFTVEEFDKAYEFMYKTLGAH